MEYAESPYGVMMGQHVGLVGMCLSRPSGLMRDLSPAGTAMVGIPRRYAVQKAWEFRV